uniref:Reverse transcriptase zinc-binding domain-containing protein n=1 Tax=Rhodnius prolixus TaxID=13249 RepID=T1HTB1_RHOPR
MRGLGETRGRWTAVLLPDVRSWVGRGFGEVDYYLTQLLSGHGYFREFLRKIGKRSVGNCPHCSGIRDDAHHTFFECERWGRIRRDLEERVGQWVPERFQSIMLSGRAQWNAVAMFTRAVLTLKRRDMDGEEDNP